MGHHVLIQLLYCFLDLLVGHLLLLFAISIGRSIILILCSAHFQQLRWSGQVYLLLLHWQDCDSEGFSSVVTFVAVFLAAAVFCACTVMTLEIGSMVIMVTSV